MTSSMIRKLALLCVGVGGLAGLQALLNEDLVPEGGAVSALTLPLDKEASTTAFETATFGLG